MRTYYRLHTIRGIINEINHKQNFINIYQNKMYHLDRNNCCRETLLQFNDMQKGDDIVIKYISIEQKDNYFNVIISNYKYTIVDEFTDWILSKICYSS